MSKDLDSYNDGKFNRLHPRPGSWTLTCQRSKFPINSDDAVKQYNGHWVHKAFYRRKHPNEDWRSPAENLSVGESANNLGVGTRRRLRCRLRNSAGVIIGVYESTNPYTCELASAAEIAAYQPTVSDYEFSILRPLLADNIEVGTVVATDPNGFDLSYEITAGDTLGSLAEGTETFLIDDDTGLITVKTSSNITSSITQMILTVACTNSQRLSVDSTVTINIRPFDPTYFGDAALWMDPSQTSLITSDGANLVSQVLTATAAGVDLFQGTSANQPSLIESNQNGLDVIRFNQTASVGTEANTFYLSATDDTAADFKYLHDGTTAWTVITVVKPTTPTVVDTGGNSIILSTTDGNIVGKVGVEIGYSTSQNRMFAAIYSQASGTQVANMSSSASVTLDTYHVMIYVHVPNAATGQTVLFGYLDGTLISTAGTKSSVAYSTNNPTSVLNVGRSTNSSQRMIGSIGEVSIVKADLRNDVALITSLLQDKWGL